MATIIKLGAAAFAASALGACAPVAQNFGEAHYYNKYVQTVNPTPVYAEGDAEPGDNGERAVSAVEGYRKGTVKQPRGGQSGQSGSGQGGQGGMGGLGAATGPR